MLEQVICPLQETCEWKVGVCWHDRPHLATWLCDFARLSSLPCPGCKPISQRKAP